MTGGRDGASLVTVPMSQGERITRSEALAWARGELRRVGIQAPEREARLILLHVLGVSPLELHLDPTAPLDGAWGRFRELVLRRAERYPLAYLLGEVGFLDFTLRVEPGVFIPRPETEGLAEIAQGICRSLEPGAEVLDLGTGTGALAIALARCRTDLRVVATDISPAALECARGNAQRLGLEGRIEFLLSDWFQGLSGRFQLIVSNPPYIPSPLIPGLDPEVALYEPKEALDGGEDGLDAIRAILVEAPRYLTEGGWLLLEIGDGQGEAVASLAADAGQWTEIEVEPDLCGKGRYFIARCSAPMR